jgi:hypothetical protein
MIFMLGQNQIVAENRSILLAKMILIYILFYKIVIKFVNKITFMNIYVQD